MSKFCKDCEYFDASDHRYPDEKSMGHCGNKVFHEGYGDPPNKKTSSIGAIIENDEGWGWVVAPNFGCIHFEEITS